MAQQWIVLYNGEKNYTVTMSLHHAYAFMSPWETQNNDREKKGTLERCYVITLERCYVITLERCCVITLERCYVIT